MDKDKIKQYIIDFQEKDLPNSIKRDTEIKTSSKIQTIIGARRVGKTYLLFNKMKELLDSKIDKKQIIYLNFEKPILHDISYKEIKEIIEIHWSVYPETANKKIYLFVDEPQNLGNWEIAIRDLHDQENFIIFITGSSSKLLSREIATSLRGRAISTTLLPLSFEEFLRFKGFNFFKNELSTAIKAKIMNYFEEYLKFGGYPEIVLEEDENNKIKILKDYFDLTIYKDLVDRYRIKNTQVIKWMVDCMVSSTAKNVSLNNMFLILKSKGIKVSKNTLYEYFSMLEDSFFLFALRKFDYSAQKKALSIPKIYLDDSGFLNLFSLEEYGKRLENAVFLQLMRDKKELDNINYWKSSEDKEVDFVLSRGKKVVSAIQVCYSLNEQKTMEREIMSLLDSLKTFKLEEGLILTKDESDEIIVKGKKIIIKPVWKWLLEQ